MRGQGSLRSLRRAPLAAAAALALTISVGTASAHKVVFDTNLQLKQDDLSDTVTQYSGKITSRRGACVAGRTVSVSVSGVFVGSAPSSASGFWVLTGAKPLKGAIVVASTPRKVLKKKRKHRHKCRPASVQRRAK